jgi:hypothetical protein
MSAASWIVLALVVVAVAWVIWAFNRLVRYRNRADEGWSQIDVQLRRRYDLIPNRVAAVQGYAAHERETFESVTKARAQAEGATSVGGNRRRERGTSGWSVARRRRELPHLKANELPRAGELTGTESVATPGILQRSGSAAEHSDPDVPLEHPRVDVPLHPARVLDIEDAARDPCRSVQGSDPCTNRSRGISARRSCCSRWRCCSPR